MIYADREPEQFFIGLRVKLTVSIAESPYPEWMCGTHEFDLARLPLTDRWAFMTAYQRAAQVGDVGTVAGIHRWPDRTDYMLAFPDGLYGIAPSDGIEFYDFGNIILVPMDQLPKELQ
jgi:hypothetical protein